MFVVVDLRRLTYLVNTLAYTRVNVHGFFEKIFSPTFKNTDYYHFLREEKGEDFINKKKGFGYRPWKFLKKVI